MHQVTRNQPGVSSAKSSAWLAVPADRPARDNSALWAATQPVPGPKARC